MTFQTTRLAVAAALVAAAAGAHAADFSFAGTIAHHNDVVQIGFTLGVDASNVKVWTDSYQGGVNFDPITAVWKKSGADWTLVGQNDDNGGIAAGQTRYDSGLVFSSLAAGDYLFTIATYNNWAKGNVLADGFTFDNQSPIPLSQWSQPSNHANMGPNWSVHLSGVDTAMPVPEPETYALMLAGLGLVGAIARRRRAA